MKNRIVRSAVCLVTVVGLGALILVSRYHAPAEAMAQSQEKRQTWEYCYVSSPFTHGTAGNYSFKVLVSQGGEKTLADSDATGVSALNKLGAEGWELVSASDDLDYNGKPGMPPTRFFMKRPK